MPTPKNIPSRTITLLIGIIVALFLFLSTLFFQNEEQEATGNDSKASTSQSVTKIKQGALSIFTLIKKIP
jgi:hypothetical protein